MKRISNISVLLITLINLNYAQVNCELTPALEQEIPNVAASPMDFCFDVEWVQENCIPVYINVNVHFFLDDNCQGNIGVADYVQGNLTQQNAFNLAEAMINDANDFFEVMSENDQGQWNSAAHSTTETDPQCIPIRYVLNGVYIHCDSDAQNTNNNFSDFNSYEVYGSTTMNIYVANVNGGTTGFASNSSNDAVVENFSPGLLNHELAHGFSVGHTFWPNDGCDDTWDYDWEWDLDCDGTPDIHNDKCWNHQPKHNGEDACDTNIFCEEHPCCDWSAQNNNLMTYSAWAGNPDYSALTPCQITQMLTDISDNMCDYVEDINCVCPPPKANIGTLPTVDGSSKCPTCFYMNASFNESVYDMEIVNQSGTTIIETGEVFNEAGKFCITPRINKWGQPYWPNGFQTGHTYTIKLKVWNECGDSHENESTFTLPPPCGIIAQEPHEPVKFEFIKLSPNPTSVIVAADYNIKQTGVLNIYGVHHNSNSVYSVVNNANQFVGDEQTIQIDISNWQSGTNAIIFQFEDEIHVENFIKL